MTNDGKKPTGLPAWSRPEVIRAWEDARLARYRAMTPEQRAELFAVLCRAATQISMSKPIPRGTERFRLPLPESTIRLWQRLRGGYHWRRPRS